MNLGSIIGGLIMIIGIILFIGNVSGCASTFPMAGFLTMTLGSFIMRASRE